MLISYSLALLTAIMWGIGAHMERYALDHVHNSTLFFVFAMAYFVAGIIVAILYRKKVSNDLVKKKSLIPFVVLTALLSSVISVFIYQGALGFATVSNVHIVIALAFTAPLFATIVSILWFKQSICTVSIIGVCMIVLGSVLLITTSR